MASELTATATALSIGSWQNNYHRHGPALKCWLAGNTLDKVYRKYEELKQSFTTDF